MRNKNLNKVLFASIFLTILGCQATRGFQMTKLKNQELNVVSVDTRRIIHECYFLNAEKENQWRHQYVLYMLNENNEAIPVFYPINQDKDQCMSHLNKVARVLKNQNQVKLCVRGTLQKMVEPEVKLMDHDFGPLGRHKSPYNALIFDTICDSKECFSIRDTWTHTCPDLN
jgi:hypothetical protein